MAEIRRYVTHDGANATYASDLEELNNIITNVLGAMPFNSPAILTNGDYSEGIYEAGYVMLEVSGTPTIFGYPTGLTYEPNKYLYCKIEDDSASFSERTDSESEETYYQYKKYTQFTNASGSLADNLTIFLVGQITEANINYWKRCINGYKVSSKSIGWDNAIDGEGGFANFATSGTNFNVRGNASRLIYADEDGGTKNFTISTLGVDNVPAAQKKSYLYTFDVIFSNCEASFNVVFAVTRGNGSVSVSHSVVTSPTTIHVVRLFLGYDNTTNTYWSNAMLIEE